jgi:Protein of unknown function (DUF3298)
MYFKTFSFFLDPVIPIRSLRDIFVPDKLDVALEIIQTSVREQLRSVLIAATDKDTSLSVESIYQGTKDWESFGAFMFGKKEIEIRFAPYEVAAYAFGPQTAGVNYERIVSLMRKEYVDALGIEGFLWAAERNKRQTSVSAEAAVAAPDAAK